METRKDDHGSGAPGGASCLTLRGLSKAFGGLEAVNQVDLEIRKGERRAIIGPNGAGKTTLFNLVSGEMLPTRGSIFLFGRDITGVPAHRRAHLGISRTFQITNLFPSLTVTDNILLAVQALGKTKFNMLRPAASFRKLYDRVDEMLVKVGMADRKSELVKNLSYGEQRQVEVTMALLGEPCLLLLDEPTAGLAPAESALMVSILKSLSPALTILIIEHDMDVAFQLSDSITVLNFGRVLADGTKGEIRANADVQRIYLKKR
jgi:branched-chain amino acid transport system ATP-binding protein